VPENQLPLSEAELVALRQIIKDAEHATYLRKLVFLVVPIVFVVISGVVSAATWVVSHITFKP
jgi:hypothetical protein